MGVLGIKGTVMPRKQQINDSVDLSDKFEHAGEDGDIILLATDGVFDNLFDDTILAIIERVTRDQTKTPDADKSLASAIAEALLKAAFERSISGSAYTPFEDNATAAGLNWRGGKRDDMALVVATISFAGTD